MPPYTLRHAHTHTHTLTLPHSPKYSLCRAPAASYAPLGVRARQAYDPEFPGSGPTTLNSELLALVEPVITFPGSIPPLKVHTKEAVLLVSQVKVAVVPGSSRGTSATNERESGVSEGGGGTGGRGRGRA